MVSKVHGQTHPYLTSKLTQSLRPVPVLQLLPLRVRHTHFIQNSLTLHLCSTSNDTGLLLLCEVAARPFFEQAYGVRAVPFL
jgi:hypothetical protein